MEIIHGLLRAGYDSDLNIEGWHDPVFRDAEGILPADIKLTPEEKRAGRKAVPTFNSGCRPHGRLWTAQKMAREG